jgi:multisubunit Na+/H+ antiporter MnhC subunit
VSRGLAFRQDMVRLIFATALITSGFTLFLGMAARPGKWSPLTMQAAGESLRSRNQYRIEMARGLIVSLLFLFCES